MLRHGQCSILIWRSEWVCEAEVKRSLGFDGGLCVGGSKGLCEKTVSDCAPKIGAHVHFSGEHDPLCGRKNSASSTGGLFLSL